MNSIVRTYMNHELDLLAPHPDQIDILDIAHHLSKLDRYNGAGSFPYSVGQHSLLVASVLPEEFKLWGLLHDATEAYLGDVVSPLKALLPNYRAIEALVHEAVCARFDLVCPRPQKVKEADKAIMALEMGEIFGWFDLARRSDLPEPPAGLSIEPMHWEDVKDRFLGMYLDLAYGQVSIGNGTGDLFFTGQASLAFAKLRENFGLCTSLDAIEAGRIPVFSVPRLVISDQPRLAV